MTISDQVLRRYLKPALFMLCLLPLALLIGDGMADGLGANPVEAISHHTGEWALRFLLITLAVTPLRRLSGWPWPLKLRRMLGLYAFFYALLHLCAWVWLDQWFNWQGMLEDVLKRPYILVGMLGFVLMLPLALTSTKAAMRRLGRNWQRLHKLIYPLAGLGVLHFLWLTKADYLEPGLYALVLAILLAFRLPLSRPLRA